MPISLNPSLSSSSTGSITDRAVQLLNFVGINRTPVKYRVVEGHRFEALLLKELTPTFCSHCDDFIWGFDVQRCRLCKLTIHKNCLDRIRYRCVKGQGVGRPNHFFEENYFKTPTCCGHCGSILLGVLESQGLKCRSCEIPVHRDCERFVCHPCEKKNLRNSSTSNETRKISNEPRNWSKISIQDFELIRLLGTGTFSKVYLGKLSEDPSLFAIKVVKKTNPTVGGDPESALTEMRCLHHGRHYPFLTIAHCCFQSEERLFFVMEYVIGCDLVYHLRKSRKFTEDRAKFYSAEIVLAISFLHQQGVVYRDLKLENIILDEHGHCKLIDFGMSKEIAKCENHRTRTFCGTPSYISPEVIRELDYGFSVDWWALGVLMFEMLTGCSPFEALSDDQDELYKKIAGQEDVKFPLFLSEVARCILEGLLNRDPQNRLGCQLLMGGEQAIFEHPFFLFQTNEGDAVHRWDDLVKKQIPAPYLPKSDELEHYEDETPTLTPVASDELKKISQTEFEGFSYHSESFESLTSWQNY